MEKVLGFLRIAVYTITLMSICFYFLFLRFAFQHFQEASSDVIVGITVITTTVLIYIVATFIEKIYSKKRDIREAHRESKNEIYSEYINKVIGFLQKEPEYEKSENSKSTREKEKRIKELTEYFQSYVRKSTGWASPKVLRTFSKFHKHIVSKGNPYGTMVLLEDLLKEMRKDLGHSNKGLKKGDLIKMWLRPQEWEKLDKILKEKKYFKSYSN